jgi:putative phosphoribosyl transferase
MVFTDRTDAGRRLASQLRHLHDADAVVLALPRGGVPVGYEVARALGAPLDVIVVRKLGVPFQPELAMGAIGEGSGRAGPPGGVIARAINQEVVRLTGVNDRELAAVELSERAELRRRIIRYRGGRPRVPVAGRTAVVVDDGIATGATARAACQVARAQGAARVVLAIPVAPASAVAVLAEIADEVICVETPGWFGSVGQWYADFGQTPDEQVVALLDRADAGAAPAPVGADTDDPPGCSNEHGAAEVVVPAGAVALAGRLTVPEMFTGLVVLAHGGAQGRYSPRGQYLAELLHHAGLGTLLVDLLTADEAIDRVSVFDVRLLGERLIQVVDWLCGQPEGKQTPIGLFGEGTGAAAALWAAADVDAEVAAVVCVSGRPDLAGDRITAVQAPTLLLVGGRDHTTFDLNRAAHVRLRCPKRLTVMPGAGHLFEEPGLLEAAVQLAREWFGQHLRGA